MSTVTLTPFDLRQMAGGQGNAILLAGISASLPKVQQQYDISTNQRLALFLAECCEETAHFNVFHEYASGSEYEGRHDLGNTSPGDGIKFKGRGGFMLTGRYNYTLYGKILGLDLVNHPELLEQPLNGMLSAGLFWHAHNLNAKADLDDGSKAGREKALWACTQSVNGGQNGAADREACLTRIWVTINAKLH